MSEITPPFFSKPMNVTLQPPGSKSLTNRALVLAALAQGSSTIRNVLLAEDTRFMLESLQKLGFELNVDETSRSAWIRGTSGDIPAHGAKLFCGNSGTTIRFLSALCALGKGEFILDGVARMRQRPIGELGTMLKNLGVRVAYPQNQGFPPIQINADRLPGGRLHCGAAQSSQYLSAVLHVAPYARNEIRIDLGWPQTSWPYVAMTMRLMDEFSRTPELIRDEQTGRPEQIVIPQGPYIGREYTIEPDASSAGYFLAAAAIHPGSRVTIENLGKSSFQGDAGFADLLHQMGAELVFGRDFITVVGPDHLEGIDVSMADMPDMAQTLAVVALFAEGPTMLRGLHTLRVKETDRLAALANELQKLGARVEIEGDALGVEPPERIRPATIDTYDDHRMAMSFSVAATRVSGIIIRDPKCVNKTYPGFFQDLSRLSAD